MDDMFEALRRENDFNLQIELSRNAAIENEKNRADEIEQLWRTAGFTQQNFTNQPACLFSACQLSGVQKQAMIDGQLALGRFLATNVDIAELQEQIQAYVRIVNGASIKHHAICKLLMAIANLSRPELETIVGTIVDTNSNSDLSKLNGRFPDLRKEFGLTSGMLFNRRKADLDEVKDAAFEVWRNANPSGWNIVAEENSSYCVDAAVSLCRASAKYWQESPVDIEQPIKALELAIDKAESGDLSDGLKFNERLAIYYELVLASLLEDSARLRLAVEKVLSANDGLPFEKRVCGVIDNATWNVGLRWSRHPVHGPDLFCVDQALAAFMNESGKFETNEVNALKPRIANSFELANNPVSGRSDSKDEGQETYRWPEHYERDKWIYDNVPLNTFGDTVTKLEKIAISNDWELITSRNGLKKAARRFAAFHGFVNEISFNQ